MLQILDCKITRSRLLDMEMGDAREPRDCARRAIGVAQALVEKKIDFVETFSNLLVEERIFLWLKQCQMQVLRRPVVLCGGIDLPNSCHIQIVVGKGYSWCKQRSVRG